MTDDQREIGRIAGLLEAQAATLLRIETKTDGIETRLRAVEQFKSGEVKGASVRKTMIYGFVSLLSSAAGVLATLAAVFKGGGHP